MPYDSDRGRKSHIYVMHKHVNGRDLVDSDSNACYFILKDGYDRIDEETRRQFDAYVAKQDREMNSLAGWAKEFFDACALGGPWPRRDGQLVERWFEPDGTTRSSRLSILMLSLRFLYEMGEMGATANEIKQYYRMASDGFSGSLSAAHKAGAIACLKEKR